MTGFSVIDLAKLPSPDVVETLDFEKILQDLKADLLTRAPEFSGSSTFHVDSRIFPAGLAIR